ncbi:hypothetical protein Asru_0264_09 [Acidisphaera rubrifaciens HS-AP3]|uniref:Uncharacterized protein n=1 Tax=Acidisphaera rubrifaciens HS-AP3 TaxID=1231350 RepID=A0A0D6P6G8_9PROT|nr:hypothetical protein Asru_0264_09 [Acidisphaera rubrifaciens HS-AP3]
MGDHQPGQVLDIHLGRTPASVLRGGPGRLPDLAGKNETGDDRALHGSAQEFKTPGGRVGGAIAGGLIIGIAPRQTPRVL